jgi:hypothetical protein
MLMEENSPRVFESRVLRSSFKRKTDEVMEKWGRLHNGKLHD